MQLLGCVLKFSLLASALPSVFATSWGFGDATVSVRSGDTGIKESFREKIVENKALSQVVPLGDSDTLKVALTTQEGHSARRPHQAFLLLKDPETGLDISYAFSVNDKGNAKLEVTQKDLPIQFLAPLRPLDASIVIGSFGSSKAYRSTAFNLVVDLDPALLRPSSDTERYGKLPEIHHVFKSAPKSPPVVVTLVFTVLVLATFPVLASVWFYLGANLNHLSAAMKSAPVPHLIFVGSIIGLESIFFMYYISWDLFQTLPIALAVGAIMFISGSRALSEVQGRRLAGLR